MSANVGEARVAGKGFCRETAGVDRPGRFADRRRMSSVAEIQSAIERLSPLEVNQVAAWLEEYQQMINASASMFTLYEREERDHAQG